MDVTPPSLLRRLGLALAGLAVAALTGAACALSFDDLRALAVTGEARQDLAFLYPAAFDALLVVALVGVLLLRSAKMLVRVQAAFVLVLLIAAAAAANVATAVRVTFDVRQTAIGVALAPWVMLALALWLWLLLIKHVQAHRAPAYREDEEQDLVPFQGSRADEAPPLATETPAPLPESLSEPTPVVGPTAAPETPPVSGRVTEWPVQNEEDPEPRPTGKPLSRPEPEPVTRPLRTRPEPEAAAREETQAKPREEPQEEPREEPRNDVQEDVREEAVSEPDEEPLTRPVRWGDRVKPADVLVHPRPSPESTDQDADTQPHPVFDDDAPDPHHGPELADDQERRRGEETREEMEDTAPHRVIVDDSPAPAERLRSTPRPPED